MHERFVASFRKGLEAEKAALRSDSTAYEVPLENGSALTEMRQRDGHFYAFHVPRPSDRLSPGVQCNLREPSGLEVPATIVQLDGQSLVLRCEAPLRLIEGSYRLVFVPWFLYDGMANALESVPFPEAALRAFGKVPAARTALEPVILESALNDTQRAAVQQAVESQLTVLWGPPGTGKTTTLAELVANLTRLGRRVLIASTTHAALDQVLGRLHRTPALSEAFATGRVVRLGFSGGDTFGCSLSETVSKTQGDAQACLDRSLRRLFAVREQLQRLLGPLERCAQLAAAAQQLDLFAAEPGAIGHVELEPALGSGRARRVAALGVQAQYAVLSRLEKRLERAEFGLKARARAARLVLANGQQQAIDEAAVLLSTLANIYVSPLMKGQEFDTVIVEEAGMALLPAIYLAAGRGKQQTILVGDPQQLPAILTSRDPYAQQSLGRNIFAVLGACEQRVMLDVQYRMHPRIGELVSGLFYAGGLRHCAPDTDELAAREPFPGEALLVVDCQGTSMTDPGDFSRYNPRSADMAVELATRAAAAGSSVAVIAPYRKQVRRIAGMLADRGVEAECATVHRFQGNERDVVILDIVDAPPLEPGVLLGRAGAANLLNVSLSRARGKLILLVDVNYVRSRAAGGVLHQVLEAALKQGVLIA